MNILSNDIVISNISLGHVNQIKDLGIIFESNLSFKIQTASLNTLISTAKRWSLKKIKIASYLKSGLIYGCL